MTESPNELSRPKHAFKLGNRFGKGNPAGGVVERFRHVILNATRDEDVIAAWKAVLDKAKGGDVRAAKLVFDRLLGKSPQPIMPMGSDAGVTNNNLIQVLMGDAESLRMMKALAERAAMPDEGERETVSATKADPRTLD
jgi:hypothetical protein